MKIHEDDSNCSKANKRVQAGERSGDITHWRKIERKKNKNCFNHSGQKIYEANREMQNVLYTRDK